MNPLIPDKARAAAFMSARRVYFYQRLYELFLFFESALLDSKSESMSAAFISASKASAFAILLDAFTVKSHCTLSALV